MEQDEDIAKYAQFISLQEEKKDKEKDKEKDDEEDENQSSNLSSPAINLLSPSVAPGPTPPGELRIDVKKGGMKIPTTVPQAVKSENPMSLGRPGLFSSGMDTYVRTGFPSQTARTVRDVVAQNTLRPMSLAASYIPFNSGQELNENVKRMKLIVGRLLSKSPHKEEINKMKSEIRGE